MTQLNIGQELVTGLHYNPKQIDIRSGAGKMMVLSALTDDNDFWLRNKTSWNCLLADSFGVNTMRSTHDPLLIGEPADDLVSKSTTGYLIHYHLPVTLVNLEHVVNVLEKHKAVMLDNNLVFLVEIISNDQKVLDAVHEIADMVVDYSKGFLEQPVVIKTDPVIRLAEDMGAL